MFFNPSNLPHYLAARGLITWEEIVSGDFQIQESGRRNRNYKVLRGDLPGLFVKQVPMIAGETVASMYREAACYEMTEGTEAFAVMRPLIPRLLDYDSRRHCLVTQLLPEGEALSTAHYRLNAFPLDIAALTGAALGKVHHTTSFLMTAGKDLPTFPRQPHWVLSVARNAESTRYAEPGMMQAAAAVRSVPAVVAGLAALHQNWRYSALINGDVKWDNLLLQSTPEKRLFVLDWELSDIGEPAWDIGSALAAYLQYWIMLLGADASTLDTRALMLSAPHRLETVTPAIAEVWKAYVRERGWSEQVAMAELRHTVGHVAARLILTTFEMGHQAPHLNRSMALLLQFATALFTTPEQAAHDLLGLSLSHPVHAFN